MDLFVSPPRNRPPYRPSDRVRLLTRIGAVIGVLVVIAWLGCWSAAMAATPRTSYTWAGASSIYLANTHYEPVTCTVTPARGDARDFRIRDARPRYWKLSELAINGTRLSRWFSGTAVVTCGDPVAITSGPLLWLYPVSYTPIPALVAIALLVIWWRFGRVRREQSGPSARSMRVARFLMGHRQR
jgi:hypothetical protein